MSRPPFASNPLRTTLGKAVRGLGVALLLVAATASAQNLDRLLPHDTFVAVGVSGLQDHEDKFQPFIDEWERLDLGTLLAEAFPEEEAEDLEDLEEAIPEQLAELGFNDLLGDEVWFGLSASRTNPLPAFSLVARVSDAAAAAFEAAIDQEAAAAEFQVLTEGKIDFRVGATDEFDDPIAFAIEGNMIFASSNPDVLRGVLRRYQGASEPNFLDSAGYAAAVAPNAPGNFVVYFDLPSVVDLVQPFAAGMGFDASVNRVSRAVKTFGTYGSVSRITDEGIESRSLQVLGDPSLDPTLYALLTDRAPVSPDAMTFVGEGVIGYQAVSTDATGWWAYLDELVADLPELGIGGLDAFITQNIGLDMNQLLFGWMGDTFATISPDVPGVTEVGIAPANLLGEAVYLIETTDEAAARQGLQMLIQMGGAFATGFADPYGEGDAMPTTPQTRDVGGVQVDTYDFADGVTLELAITDGYVLLATGEGSMDTALAARAAGGNLPSVLADLADELPQSAASISIMDGGAYYGVLAEQFGAEFGLIAGMVGDFDFDAAEAAGEALVEFLGFVADRVGGAYSYGVSEGDVLSNYSISRVTW